MIALFDDSTPQSIKKTIYAVALISVTVYLFEINFPPEFVRLGNSGSDEIKSIDNYWVRWFLASTLIYLAIHLILQRKPIQWEIDRSELAGVFDKMPEDQRNIITTLAPTLLSIGNLDQKELIRELDAGLSEFSEAQAWINEAIASQRAIAEAVTALRNLLPLDLCYQDVGSSDFLGLGGEQELLVALENLPDEYKAGAEEACRLIYSRISSYQMNLFDVDNRLQEMHRKFQGSAEKILELVCAEGNKLSFLNVEATKTLSPEPWRAAEMKLVAYRDAVTLIAQKIPDSDIVKILDAKIEKKQKDTLSRVRWNSAIFVIGFPSLIAGVAAALLLINPDWPRSRLVTHSPSSSAPEAPSTTPATNANVSQ